MADHSHITDEAVTPPDASKLMNDAIEAAPHRLYGPLAFLAQDRLMNAQRVADMAALAGEIREGGTAERQIREGVALAKAVMATPSPAALPVLNTTTDAEIAELRRRVETLEMFEQEYLNVSRILDTSHGTNEDDGAGAGIAADVHLLMRQRDEARAELDQHRSGESYEIGENYGRTTQANSCVRDLLQAVYPGDPMPDRPLDTVWKHLLEQVTKRTAELDEQRARAERRMTERDEALTKRDGALTKLYKQGTRDREEIAYLRGIVVKDHVHTDACAHQIALMEVEGASECSHCGPYYGGTEQCPNRCDIVRIEHDHATADAERKRLALSDIVADGGTV